MGLRSILKSAVEEVFDFLQWLSEKVQDEEARKEILLSLGLNPENASIPPPNTDASLQSIDTYLSKTDEEIDLEAFSSVVADIINIGNALESFAHMVADDDPTISGREFLEFAVQLYVMDYVRLRQKDEGENKKGYNPIFVYKRFYWVFKYVDFFTELTTVQGGTFGISTLRTAFRLWHKSLHESNQEWSKRLDGQHLTDEEWEVVYNNLSAAERFVYQEKQMSFATFLIGVGLGALAYKFAPGVRNNILYGFDSPELSTSPAADTISKRTVTLATTFDHKDVNETETSTTIYITAVIKPPWHSGEFEISGIGLKWILTGDLKLEHEFDNNIKLSVESNSLPTENANVEIKLEHGSQNDRWVMGDSKGTRLEIGIFSFEIKGSVADEDLDFKISVRDCAFVLHKGRSDSFIASVLPDKGITGIFNLGIGYSVKRGWYLDGGSGLSVLIPLHAAANGSSKKLNLILHSLFLDGKISEDEKPSLELSVGFTASLLGFIATVERMGLLITDEGSNMVRFKPPNGIGLSFDIGKIQGGGYLYLDAEKGEYSGALEVKLGKRFSLKAVGVISTKIPNIDYSLLVILTVQFDPPVPLFMGFTWSGIGGIMGLNRTVDIEVLKESIKTNAIRSVLFPQDVIANIPRIVSDIKQIFPPAEGRTVLGLMFEFKYENINLFKMHLGLVVELDVGKLLILGMISFYAPQEDDQIIRVQCNFIGIIDFDNQFMSLDAELYDSKILGWTLTGSIAFRLKRGEDSFFVLSAGGFHPAFQIPAGQGLENMKRITFSLLSGENPRITIQLYLAFTSNTFQFGGKAELYASKGSFNIYGYISLDALFRRTEGTITLLAQFAAGVALRRNTSVIMGIHVSGEFSGFEPCHVHGKASVSFLFFSISVSFSKTWGEDDGDVDVSVDVLSLVTNEVNNSNNWRAELPANNNLHVSIKKIELPQGEQDKVVVHPFGILTFSQLLVPLNLQINKFGTALPANDKFFEIKPADEDLTTEPVKEQFAPGNFLQLTDEEKLARPSFESMTSGFSITGSAALQTPVFVPKSVEYELTYLGNRNRTVRRGNLYQVINGMFATSSKGSAAFRSPLSHTNNRNSPNAPQAVEVSEPAFAIANVSDLKLHALGLVSNNYTEALQQFNTLVSNNPGLKEQIQIVSHFELNKN